MTSSLVAYGPSDDEENDVPVSIKAAVPHPDETLHLEKIKSSSSSLSKSVVAAQEIYSAHDVKGGSCVVFGSAKDDIVDPLAAPQTTDKVLLYNPTAAELFQPESGPANPFHTQQRSAAKNTISGLVEPAHVDHFAFELQRKTFFSRGYAADPSDNAATTDLVGSSEKHKQHAGVTVFEKDKDDDSSQTKPPEPSNDGIPVHSNKRRKKEAINNDPSDIEGYLGPWAKLENEVKISKPNAEDQKYLDEYQAKLRAKNPRKYARKQRLARGDAADEDNDENEEGGDGPSKDKGPECLEKSILHLDTPYDYQGRSFLHPPQDVGTSLKPDYVPDRCYLPKKLLHTWKGHQKGVNCIRWFPGSAHLILSGSNDTSVRLWKVYDDRKCVMTYQAHAQGIRDVCFQNDGKHFITASYDRHMKYFDTETGQVVSRFSNRKLPLCIKFNPDAGKQNLFVAGMQDRKIYCWDIRTKQIVQEYDRHMGPVNSITFVDNNRRMVTTSDDKSIRVWEWNIPVDFKYIADPSMHAVPTMSVSPNGKWLAAQSMDNKIKILNVYSHFKILKKKEFTGHMVASYSCATDWSPDMSYLMSGDGDGKVFIWDFKSTKCYSKFKAHDEVCLGVLWHPHETSKIATCSWDSTIKFWD